MHTTSFPHFFLLSPAFKKKRIGKLRKYKHIQGKSLKILIAVYASFSFIFKKIFVYLKELRESEMLGNIYISIYRERERKISFIH